MARLAISLLGTFHATVGERTVSFRSDTERALLAYLAVELDRAHSRETLAALLWPDREEETARKNLRNSIHRLRQALAVEGDPDAPFLLITPEGIQFDPHCNYAVDAREFTDLLAACKTHRHRRLGACPDCRMRLTRAVGLYRGEFLTAISLAESQFFGEWASVMREALHREMLLACHTLADYYLRRGDHAHAGDYARRQLALEPWREEAHLQLMQALAGSGQRSAALAQYQTCRSVLLKELGAEPGAAMIEAAEHLRRDEPLFAAPPLQAPEFSTPFFGREEELTCIAVALADPDSRLITITGIGGVGKTRLAVEVARRHRGAFRDGIFFVPLDELTSPESIPGAITAALGLSLSDSRPLQAQLWDYLRGKELLLTLDNCEHLSGAVAAVCADILRMAPQVALLCTSHEPLNLRAEQRFPVRGLPTPSAPPDQNGAADLERSPAVALFLDRVRRVRPGFALDEATQAEVLGICQLLDGLPLGLELAASGLNHRTLAEVLQTLTEDMASLATNQADTPLRQRRLITTLEYTWERLAPDEQQALARLTIFQGGFDRAAAQAVAGASINILGTLDERSLLRLSARGRLDLHPLVRQFIVAKQTASPDLSGGLDNLAQRHSAYYLQMAGDSDTAPHHPAMRQSLQRVQADWHNIRTAWHRACQRGDSAAIGPASRRLFWYCEMRDEIEKGRRLFREASAELESAAAENAEAAVTRALALASEGWFAWRQARSILPFDVAPASNFETAKALAEESLALLRRAGKEALAGDTHLALGLALMWMRAFARAEEELHTCVSLHEAQNNLPGRAYGLHTLAQMRYFQRDASQSEAYLRESLALFEACGDQRGAALALNSFGDLAALEGKLPEAESFYQRSCALMEMLGYAWGMALGRYELGRVAAAQGDYARARREHHRSLALLERGDDRRGMAENRRRLTMIALQAGDMEEAKTHLRAALEIAAPLQAESILLSTLTNLGEWNTPLDDLLRAQQNLGVD